MRYEDEDCDLAALASTVFHRNSAWPGAIKTGNTTPAFSHMSHNRNVRKHANCASVPKIGANSSHKTAAGEEPLLQGGRFIASYQ